MTTSLVALARCQDQHRLYSRDWPLYGPKLAQVALTVGADDIDGIAATDRVLGTAAARLKKSRPTSCCRARTGRAEFELFS
jgi:2-iminoacetate synthase ThiH